jgi:hypothetical protein
MPSEMQERIARALCRRQCINDWKDQSSMVKDGFLLDALAVMKSLRRATSPMVDAGRRFSSLPSVTFEAMLDAEITLAEGGARDRD